MHKSEEGLKLTRVQFIAIKACQAERERAQMQFIEVQKEIGLDPTKNYNVTDDGVVTEAKQEVIT